ncbi:tyrosine-type recombinase/integrase [Paenibacillus sediminis]|uniref:Integrase/recombinase XerD n=1 Tax=Paenibacillus sediminis TaxID=664909 RepID=A0ABS4H6L8_9BACL|nr:tyrosine-type recombinase/integrase [Paenibacillus sediminis]MBP1938126.1 integrase/recombinase XerD [Paenibacillus sediminis]
MAVTKRTRRPNTIKAYVEDGESKYPLEALDFDTAIATFLHNCRVKNLSEYSVKYYDNSLKELVKFLNIVGVERPIDVTEANFKECILAKKESGVKDSTVNTNLKGWRTFFRYLYEAGYLSANPAEHVTLIKAERRIIPAFSKEQIKKLLSTPDLTTFTGYRDYVLLLTLLETGIRISEVERLKITDIIWKERIIKIFGKGRKERYVPFQVTLEKELKKYISVRGPLEHDYLFVNIDNTPMKKRTMQENIQKIGIAANIKGVRVSPHTFRHTFAKFYIMNGGDAFSLQKILGHTTVEMVQTYVSLFGTDIAKQHRKFSPLERLNDIE